MRTIFYKLTKLGISPKEFVLFLQDAIHDARTQQEIQNILLSQEERIRLEIRLTHMEALIVSMQKEFL